MERMKVLQVNKLYYPQIGGIEKVVQQMSEGLSKREDVELKVLVCQKKGKGLVERINGVEVHRAGSFGVFSSVPLSLSFLWKFRRMAKDADIVQLHLPFPLGDLACLLSGYQGKVIAFWHSDVVKQKRWMIFYQPIMKRFLKRADLILVAAKGVANGSKYLSPYLAKCKVVPFAVEDQMLEFGGKYIENHGYARGHTRVHFLFVGRLVYYKGCSVLLNAFAKIKEDAILTIVGDGTLKSELLKQTERLGIENKVIFMGHVSDAQIKECMSESDVFVLPSIERSEAFGLVQLEAMACGIPVINTDLPSGVPEVSIHGETGLTVPPGDADELTEAMEWMIAHPDERTKMGILARKRIESNFTQELLTKNIMEVYETIIK